MKKIIITASLLTASALGFVSAASAQDWTGGYVSGFAGTSKVSSRHDNLTFDTNLDGKYGDTVYDYAHADAFAPGFCEGRPNGLTPSGGCHKSDSKGSFGVRVGYDWQRDHLVYGVIGEIAGTKIDDSVTGFSSEPNSYTFTRKLDSISAIRGRLGYASNAWLVYVTAGFAFADLHRTFTTTNAQNTFTATNGKDGNGGQVGIGIEKKISSNWTVGVEYLHTSIDDKGASVRAGPGGTLPTNPFLLVNPAGTDIRRGDDQVKNDSVELTASYRFGAM